MRASADASSGPRRRTRSTSEESGRGPAAGSSAATARRPLPRPCAAADGLHHCRARVALRPVEQSGECRARQLVRSAHQVQVRAQEGRGRVREQRAAERRRPRHVAGVERERDQELLRAVAAEHGEVAPAAAEPLLLGAQERAHRCSALRPGRRAEEPDGAVLRSLAGPDVLGLADDVVRDQPSAGLHDRPRAAIVGAQRVRGRPGPGRHPAVELQDAARVGLPPAVDELVVVADHEQPPVRAGEHVHQRELGAVQVLELVDQDVVEALLDERAVARVGEHVRDREVDLVVERLQPGRGLRAGVLRVGGGEGQVEQRRVAEGLDADLDAGRGLERRAHAREALHEGADRVAAAARLELAQRDAGGLHGARHEGAERAAVVVEREARAQHLALVAVAEGVEGGAVDAGRAVVVARRSAAAAARAARAAAPPPAASRGGACSRCRAPPAVPRAAPRLCG